MILIVLTVLLGLAIATALMQPEPAGAQQITLTKWDAHLIALDWDALNDSYQKHLSRLFDVWMSDGGKDISRISVGLRNARNGYIIAADKIEAREREMAK